MIYMYITKKTAFEMSQNDGFFFSLYSFKSTFLLTKSEKIEIKDAVQDKNKQKNAIFCHLLNMEWPVVR